MVCGIYRELLYVIEVVLLRNYQILCSVAMIGLCLVHSPLCSPYSHTSVRSMYMYVVLAKWEEKKYSFNSVQ